MWHVDLPGDEDLRWLASLTVDPTLSIYLPTSPVTQHAQADRTALRNLAREGLDAARAAGHPADLLDAIGEELDDLVDDDAYWAHQAHGLAVFVTAVGLKAFRLPEPVGPSVHVGPQPYLKPLVRVATSPRSFLVLALAQDGVRLIEASGDAPAVEVPVPDMPRSASDHAGKATINDRTFTGRQGGTEGIKVHLRSYARAVDAALRPLLHGGQEPLVLVAAEPIASIFRSVASYAHLLADGVQASPERTSATDLVAAAAPVVAGYRTGEDAALLELLGQRQAQGRAAKELGGLARAAAQGAVDTLLVDTTVDLPGDVTAEGELRLGEPGRVGGVTEALVRLTLAGGGQVRHVDADRLVGDNPAAAVLRWAV